MITIEDLKSIDLDKVPEESIKEQIQELLNEYEEVEDKESFQKDTAKSISKIYSMVKAISPEAIEGESEDKPTGKRAYKKRESKKNTNKQEAEIPFPEKDEKKKEADSKQAMKEIEEIGVEIEACRRVIRDYNKQKRDAEGKTPVKKLRITKLKDKLLGIGKLIPEKLKDDKDVRDDTKRILLETLRSIKKSWGLNVIKPAEDGIKEQFAAMDEKQKQKEAV
jgi:hypothetical protein